MIVVRATRNSSPPEPSELDNYFPQTTPRSYSAPYQPQGMVCCSLHMQLPAAKVIGPPFPLAALKGVGNVSGPPSDWAD
jgi:hypothetical protein